MHSTEDSRALTAHCEHLWHERQTFETTLLVESRPDLSPGSDDDNITHDQVMSDKLPGKPAPDRGAANRCRTADLRKLARLVQLKVQVRFAPRATSGTSHHDKSRKG